MDASLRRHARSTRAEIASGALRGAAFLERLWSVPFADRDGWFDEILGIDALPSDVPDLPRGAVPYLPSGVDEIVTMVREVPLGTDDLLVDLGSGLGRVAILAHLLTGARTHGIEIQEPLVRAARRCCDVLALEGVTFVHGNAAEMALDGSVFFLYAPCNGEMLARIRNRLRDLARRRPIVLCTIGLEFRGLDWLRPRPAASATLTLYDS